MIRKYTVEFVPRFFVALFVYAVLVKSFAYEHFVLELSQSPLFRFFPIVPGIVAVVVLATEVFVVLVLLLPQWRKVAMLSVLSLLIVFTMYIVFILYFAPYIPCSCGGILESLSWEGHLLFNGILIAIAGFTVSLMRESREGV